MADFYDPWLVIQGDGSAFQWRNCNCAAAAMALDRDTEGRHRTSGARVRTLTGDWSSGTTLSQVDLALRAGWPPDDHLDVRLWVPFSDVAEAVASGRGAILQGGYRPFHTYHLAGSSTFFGNHSIYWNECRIVRVVGSDDIDLARSKAMIFDPLWDGRRSYIPDKQYRWVPLRLLYEFAGSLDLGGRPLGLGYAYAGLTRRTPALSGVPVPPPTSTVNIDYGSNSMIVAGGIKVTSSHSMALQKGQPLYREAKTGAPVVTKMSRDAKVPFLGNAGVGWKAVQVATANFADGLTRPVTLYVPTSAGTVSAN